MMDEFGRAGCRGSISQVLGDPAIQVQELTVGELGVGVGTTEEEQGLDDLSELNGPAQRGLEDASIFFARSVLASRQPRSVRSGPSAAFATGARHRC